MTDLTPKDQQRQTGQDYFRTLLLTVVGQAFDAAGYYLQHNPLQWAGGKYRFVKELGDGARGSHRFSGAGLQRHRMVCGRRIAL